MSPFGKLQMAFCGPMIATAGSMQHGDAEPQPERNKFRLPVRQTGAPRSATARAEVFMRSGVAERDVGFMESLHAIFCRALGPWTLYGNFERTFKRSVKLGAAFIASFRSWEGLGGAVGRRQVLPKMPKAPGQETRPTVCRPRALTRRVRLGTGVKIVTRSGFPKGRGIPGAPPRHFGAHGGREPASPHKETVLFYESLDALRNRR